MSSLDLGNENSDANDLGASPSDTPNSNNRSLLGQTPSYVIPVDYSFGNTPIPTHHNQGDIESNSQNSHGYLLLQKGWLIEN